MLLGEIKLMALRLMFSDTDITYNIENIEEYYNNHNTREKLIRMNDSINRALSLYYQRVGLPRGKKEVRLSQDDFEPSDFINEVRLIKSQLPDLHDVLKVRVTSPYMPTLTNADFEYEDNTLYLPNLLEKISPRMEEKMKIEVFYEKNPRYLFPYDKDTEVNLDVLNIPLEVQLEIPKYVKSELYEEDEPELALIAKNEYLTFLSQIKKPRVIRQQSVVKPRWR